MEVLYKDKGEKLAKDDDEIMDPTNPLLSSLIAEFGFRTTFTNFYNRSSSVESSAPRFPSVGAIFMRDIPDPSQRNIPITELGKNLDDAFYGFSTANPKVSCVARDKIIFREEFLNMTDRVRIISSTVRILGDFVGRGMLTCMVLGTHGSPKPRVIYTAIKELNKTADRGILAIVPNNYDDKVNWGLAIARAHRKGITLRSIFFGDNAFPEYKEDERSCLPGIIVCYKLAGAMAEEKYTLPVIVDRLNMMFFSTISCHVLEGCIRVGTDLEGRGGFVMKDATKEEVMKEVLSYLLDLRRKYSVGYDPGTEFVIFINTYHGDCNLAQTVAVEVVKKFHRCGFICSRVYSGNIFPSVGPGFSLTILPEGSTEVVRWLDRYTSCSEWLVGGDGSVGKYNLSICKPISEAKGTWFNERQAQMVDIAVQLAVTGFKNAERFFNTNDPDLEYGTKMCKICKIVMENLKTDPLFIQYPYMLFTMIGECFEKDFKNIDGMMFALFSITLGQYFGDHKRSPRHINEKTWEKALRRSVKAVAGYFKIGYKDHTVLDIFGSFYLIMSSSRLDVLTDIHLALEVSDEYCWKAKYAKPKKIIDYPYLTMKSAYIMLDAVATMLRGTEMNKNQLAPQDIDTTPTITATKIKEILTTF